jgi:hypothetical protein
MNEMRDRLVELVMQADTYDSFECKLCDKHDDACDCCHAEKIADTILEDDWIRLPCKVGDSCYPFPRYRTPIVERKISRITYSARNIIIGYYENDGQYRPPLRTRILGEDVFLTEEEAEQKLKEMRGE